MELSETLLETLNNIPRTGITAGRLAELIGGVSSNAQSNRLERLRDVELVRRQRSGHNWRYFRK